MSMTSHKERVRRASFCEKGEEFNVSHVTSLTGLAHQRAYELLREMVADGALIQRDNKYKLNNLAQIWIRRKWV